MTPQKKASLTKTTVVSLADVVLCENRNVTSLEDTDLLPGSSDSLCFVLSVQNLCGKVQINCSVAQIDVDLPCENFYEISPRSRHDLVAISARTRRVFGCGDFGRQDRGYLADLGEIAAISPRSRSNFYKGSFIQTYLIFIICFLLIRAMFV